jgi:hypothetical protein
MSIANTGSTATETEEKYKVPNHYLRISQRTREFALKPRRDLLWSVFNLGKAIKADLQDGLRIHISDDEEVRMLAEACGEHEDVLKSCIQLSRSFTEEEFERLIEETHLSYGQIVSLALISPKVERDELLQLAITNRWSERELSKEIRRRYLPPKTIRRNPPPRSLKQARERLYNQSKKYLALLQQLFGKVEYNFATSIIDTPADVIKPELPSQLEECIKLLEQIGATTDQCVEGLRFAASYAAGAVAAQNAHSARQTENAFSEQGRLDATISETRSPTCSTGAVRQ